MVAASYRVSERSGQVTSNLKLLNRDAVVSFLLTKPIGTVVLRESSQGALQANPAGIVTVSYLAPIHMVVSQKDLNTKPLDRMIFDAHGIIPTTFLKDIEPSSNSSSSSSVAASASNSSSSRQGGRRRTRRSNRTRKNKH